MNKRTVQIPVGDWRDGDGASEQALRVHSQCHGGGKPSVAPAPDNQSSAVYIVLILRQLTDRRQLATVEVNGRSHTSMGQQTG